MGRNRLAAFRAITQRSNRQMIVRTPRACFRVALSSFRNSHIISRSWKPPCAQRPWTYVRRFVQSASMSLFATERPPDRRLHDSAPSAPRDARQIFFPPLYDPLQPLPIQTLDGIAPSCLAAKKATSHTNFHCQLFSRPDYYTANSGKNRPISRGVKTKAYFWLRRGRPEPFHNGFGLIGLTRNERTRNDSERRIRNAHPRGEIRKCQCTPRHRRTPKSGLKTSQQVTYRTGISNRARMRPTPS